MSDILNLIPPPPGMAKPLTPHTKNIPAGPLAEGHRLRSEEEKCYRQVYDIPVYRCECLRCGNVWYTLQPRPPKNCPATNCKSGYWDRLRVAPGPAKPLVPKKKGKRGRPKKYALKEVGAEGSPALATADDDIPEVPVGLLGAVDQLAAASGQDRGPAEDAIEEPFPVATPIDGGVSLPAPPAGGEDPAVEFGQSSDGGRGAAPATEDAAPAELADDYWQ